MIYLVRHGQTEFNAERRFQGALDSRLTPAGVQQGERLGRLFATLVPSDCRIISSPLGRAQHTARLIRDAACPASEIAIDDRLRETSLGDWDGCLRADVEEEAPDFDAGSRRWTWFFHAPNGDRYETVEARLRSWLEDARKLDGPTIVVSHGTAGRILRGVFIGLSVEEAMMQDIPQDACFRLHQQRVERIECA
jgi:broad specificity phosphatase PhoE